MCKQTTCNQLIDSLTEFQLGWPHMHYVFAVLCLFVVVYKLAVLFAKRKETLRNLEAFWGPPPHWLFGHVLELTVSTHSQQLQKMILPTGLLRVGLVRLICLPPTAFQVQSCLFCCFPHSCTCSSGNGLLVSEGQKWFRHRRLLTPGFHYVLKPYVKLMSESAQTMLDKWESYASTNEPFELFKHVSLMTLDSIMKCAFSCYSNCQTEGGSYKKEERSTKRREGAWTNTGKKIFGLSGHSSLCKSMLCVISFSLLLQHISHCRICLMYRQVTN
uniref:Cytochrome P450, family 4, subfamily T, polypeptide 8 n=1 Tax=Oreochromis aureus TaxID=47969 RepID=A0A668RSN6_OREAU